MQTKGQTYNLKKKMLSNLWSGEHDNSNTRTHLELANEWNLILCIHCTTKKNFSKIIILLQRSWQVCIRECVISLECTEYLLQLALLSGLVSNPVVDPDGLEHPPPPQSENFAKKM